MLSDEIARPTHSRIIKLLKNSGLDLDLIQKLKEKSNQDDSARVKELQRQLGEALQAKVEIEAKLNTLKSASSEKVLGKKMRDHWRTRMTTQYLLHLQCAGIIKHTFTTSASHTSTSPYGWHSTFGYRNGFSSALTTKLAK
ncbi:uncharacterized protein LOC123672854 [Harmonia axyridis]|uniref:uncharacterized protein LOC123672854 n=1 Tax=Harmonia axyridis TaxID=115357 RepID=UPI001E278BD6|nr:uncharacterized protein LOC123672854 [Harmonia axyridis]